MKRFLYIVVVLILWSSCTSRTIYKKPDNLIAEDKMIELWTDIAIAKAAFNEKNRKVQRGVNYLHFVYKKHQIDSARFMESNIYYTSRIEDYERMFQKVNENLKSLQAIYDLSQENQEEEELPIWVRDSIRRSKLLQNRDEGLKNAD